MSSGKSAHVRFVNWGCSKFKKRISAFLQIFFVTSSSTNWYKKYVFPARRGPIMAKIESKEARSIFWYFLLINKGNSSTTRSLISFLISSWCWSSIFNEKWLKFYAFMIKCKMGVYTFVSKYKIWYSFL